jgi:hypothetical protein
MRESTNMYYMYEVSYQHPIILNRNTKRSLDVNGVYMKMEYIWIWKFNLETEDITKRSSINPKKVYHSIDIENRITSFYHISNFRKSSHISSLTLTHM